MFKEEEAIKGRVFPLNGDVPREHHHHVKQNARPPDGAAQERPLAAKSGEQKNDRQREEGRYGTFGEGGGSSEEVEIKEPEFFAGFIPGIPAEHPDTEGRG